MANIKSQIKRARQAEVKRERNKDAKSALKTLIKKFNAAVDSEDKPLASERLKDAVKALDKSVSRGIIHKNNAANKKSGLASRFGKMPEKAPVIEEEKAQAEEVATEEKPAKAAPKKAVKENGEKKPAAKKAPAKKPAAKKPVAKKKAE